MKIIAVLPILVMGLLAPFAAEAQEPTPLPEVGLHMAALTGNVAVVRQHAAAGSDLDAKDAYGSTPLLIAVTFGKTEVMKALVEAGADVEVRNNEGSTPLHVASFLCRREIVLALLEHGARKYARNASGHTPWESVSLPFGDVRAVYETIRQGLAPLGLVLDLADIEQRRPEMAELLRPTPGELGDAAYAPAPGPDWEVTTPLAAGLGPDLLAALYLEAADLDRLRGVLVLKDGRLVAEAYYGEGGRGEKNLLQSVTKSFTSALVGVALEDGCLESVEQKMLDFFPEEAAGVTDPRKRDITLRQMLQMRAGYPWEESDPAYWDMLLTGDYLPLIEELPLTADPGTRFQYSNLTSHWLGVIVARACGTDLRSFARRALLTPLEATEGDWVRDVAGYYMGHAELRLTARDAAKLGQLYLDGGTFRGRRLVADEWVAASLQAYSRSFDSGGVENGDVGLYHRDVGYGYQWWSARAGAHRFDYAWGHGGQFVILLHDLGMVIVVVSDPFYLQHDAESWRHELANLNLVGKFIASLPAPEAAPSTPR